jgi:hypothetical protein
MQKPPAWSLVQLYVAQCKALTPAVGMLWRALLLCCACLLQGGCGTSNTASSGDYVSDTPAVRTANFQCTRVDSCGDYQGADLIQNFMVSLLGELQLEHELHTEYLLAVQLCCNCTVRYELAAVCRQQM